MLKNRTIFVRENEEGIHPPHPIGMLPSPPDSRDYLYSNINPAKGAQLPDKFVLPYRKVGDQGAAGACVGFAVAAMQEYDACTNGDFEDLSPLYIYTKCKELDGVPTQEGTFPRIAMKVLKDVGVCTEEELPYAYPNSYRKLNLPSIGTALTESGSKRKITGYARLNTLDDILNAIYNENSVLLAVLATDSLMYPQEDGLVGLLNGSIYGGHAITAIGWDKNKKVTWKGELKNYNYTGVLYFRNSWGSDWGNNGYGMIPLDLIDIGKVEQAYDLKLVNEAWTTFHTVTDSTDLDYFKRMWAEPEPNGDILIRLVQGSKTMTVNGKETELREPLTNINGRIMAPIRETFEAAGAKVTWDNNNKEATIIFEKEK